MTDFSVDPSDSAESNVNNTLYSGAQGGPYAQQGYAQQGGPDPHRPHTQHSLLAAGLMGIFLGALGVHNFYLGYVGKAIAQLLITVLSIGILAIISIIWGFIEGILILMSQPGSHWHQDAQGYELSS